MSDLWEAVLMDANRWILKVLLRRRRARLDAWARGRAKRPPGSAGPLPLYLDPTEPVEKRIDDLIGRMTLEEKIAQMSMPSGLSGMARGFATLFVPMAGHRNSRLGIPPFLSTGSSHGATYFTTAFPCAMARGASWDVGLEERVHAAIGAEARASGANVLLAPCINLLRHPGWGRAQETYGEDTHHLSRMAVAAVRGIQRHVLAQPKHYALNSIERDRFHVDVQADERTLREIYLPHFEAAVKEGRAASVMSAYNRVNGQYCGENRHLLRDILKGEWGFDGFVMSDWVFGTRSTAAAARNGLDVEMPAPVFYGRRLLASVRKGAVGESVIDDSVRRILRKKFEFGLFERPEKIDLSILETGAHRALAREAARKSMVLLKNEGGILPLDTGSLRRLAVVGRHAASARLGDLGSSTLSPLGAVSPLEGIRRRAAGVEVVHSSGRWIGAAARAARTADAAVVVVSLGPSDEGEWLTRGLPLGGDRDRLGLPLHEVRLIRAVASANPRTIVVIEAGGSVTMADWIGAAPAVLLAWYPGCEGGTALAELLFGDANPGGKLPFTIPVSEDQLYPFGTRRTTARYGFMQGYRHFDRKGIDPLFPFGYGLSYTRYAYERISLGTTRLREGGVLEVTVDVKNEGPRAGEEIVELYLSAQESRVERAPKDLRGFARLHLEPGETKRVGFRLSRRDLAYYDVRSGRWIAERGRYTVQVGPHSRDLPLSVSFEYASDEGRGAAPPSPPRPGATKGRGRKKAWEPGAGGG